MSEHLATVEHERAKYGTPLGETNAWKVTNATAYTWREEGWGLLEKTTGTNYQGYSIDVLVNVRERQAVDCLYSSETIGGPQWSVLAWEDRFTALWRAPLPPDDGPTPPEPPTDDLEARVASLESRVTSIETALRSCADTLDAALLWRP